MGWVTVERPGYLGKKRDEACKLWTEQYGEWRLAWIWDCAIIERPQALQIYEDGYYEFLKANPDRLEWLLRNASDIYDTAPSNIEARFSYDLQETQNNHLHDVAIRRAVLRLGRFFEGDRFIQVRSTDSEGWPYSPCNVPFHLPQMIVPGEIRDYPGKGNWWRRIGIENSVEEFYQQNKVLQASERYIY